MIKGIQKTTLIDYPGKVASTIFFSKCNFRCLYCYNKDLVLDKGIDISKEEVLKFLSSRKKWLDGICITGGEPSIHQDLINFLSEVKKLGLLIKLDTNGSNPDMLKKIIENKLVDYIAMDIKAPLDKYKNIAKVDVDVEKIKKSILLIKGSNIDYEFRTTVSKLISREDLLEVGKMLRTAKKYFIQQIKTDVPLLDEKIKIERYTNNELIEFKGLLKQYFNEVNIRL